MITGTTYYEVICDACGERLEIDGVAAWESVDEAREAIDYAGWVEMESGRVYCDACIDYGEIMIPNRINDDE